MSDRYRSAVTGEIVTAEYAAANPDTTVREHDEPRRVPLAEVEALHLEPGDLVVVSCPAEVSVEEAQAAFYAVRDAIPDHRALIVHGSWQVSGAPLEPMVSGLERTLAGGRLEPAEAESLGSLLDAIRACGHR